MIHPTDTAVDFIFGKFLDRYCSEKTRVLCQKIEKLHRSINHEPRFPRSPVYQEHIRSTLQQIEEMEKNLSAGGRRSWDQEKLMLSKRIVYL